MQWGRIFIGLHFFVGCLRPFVELRRMGCELHIAARARMEVAESGAVICENGAMMHARLLRYALSKSGDIDFFEKRISQ